MKVTLKKKSIQDVIAPGQDCTPQCPVKIAADILSGKWTTLIVRELLPGTKRYSQLQHALPGISPKILANRLRMLEANGLVAREIYPTIPPRTEYTLTKLGREMENVIGAMAQFGQLLSEHTSPLK